ncbi:MAG: ABC transporter permease [Paenibacillaceae bacterium ZCTH02-B3]|nr:MAG: ABC transporter permease [Paenibacillaceae bacterium ZCTH02-B3]
MNSLWTVMAFTLRNKLRSKAYIWTTVTIALLLMVGANLPYILERLNAGGSNEPKPVGYIEGAYPEIVQGLEAFFARQENPAIRLVAIPSGGSPQADEAALRQAVEDEMVKGYLTFADRPETGFPEVVFHSSSLTNFSLADSLRVGLESVKAEMVFRNVQLSEAERALLAAPVAVHTLLVSSDGEGGRTAADQAVVMALTYALIILLFMAVTITGQLVATEITAEKSSRVMEILITSVKPLTQMFGKILGTFFAGIIQIVVLVAVFVISLLMPHNRGALDALGIRLDAVEPQLLAYAIFFYLAGYFLYATLFAAIGSIVSRTEELGQATTPVMILSMVGFYIAIFSLQNPKSPLVVIGSYFPFFTPFLMFERIGLADPQAWEIALSIGILLASILLFGWLAAKIYRVGVLMYGKRPSIKELVKAMKAYKV